MLLNLLVKNVLDKEISGLNYSKNNLVDQESLFKDARIGAFYSELWRYIYGTYPTIADAVIFPNEVSNTVVNAFLSNQWMLKLGLYNRLQINDYITELSAKVNDIEFVKTSVIKKLEFRYQITIKRDRFILSFLEQVKNLKPENVPPINPFTGFHIVCAEGDTGHIIHSDVYFMNRIFKYPIIVSHKQPNIPITQKYLVFTDDPLPGQFKIIPNKMYLIPRIAPWCLCIDCDYPLSRDNNVTFEDRPNYRTVTLYNSPTYWELQIKHRGAYLTFIEFFYGYIAKLSPFSVSQEPSNKLIFLVDNRENELSVMSCKAAVYNAPGWHLMVVTSSKSRAYYERELPGAQILVLPALDLPFDIDVYNDVLEDLELWEKLELNYTHVLVIQDDGILLRRGIEQFLEYDYVGAPWPDVPENESIKKTISSNLVGNGGLSLRTTHSMVQVLKMYSDQKLQTFYHNVNRMPEDVWFVKHLTLQGAKIAPPDIAIRFSIEETMNYDAIGCHKVWMYNPIEQVNEYFRRIIQK